MSGLVAAEPKEALSAEEIIWNNAIMHCNDSVIQFFISSNFDVNKPAIDGSTALHAAVKNDNTTLIKLLLGKGANINATNNYGDTPILYALKIGSLRSFLELFYRDANFQAQNLPSDVLYSVINNPSCDYHYDDKYSQYYTKYILALLEVLFSKGADKSIINTIDKDGFTCLHVAVYRKNLLLIKKLIELGADLEIENLEKKTPLQCCPIRDDNHYFHVIKLLIDSGASIAKINLDGYSENNETVKLIKKEQNRLAEQRDIPENQHPQDPARFGELTQAVDQNTIKEINDVKFDAAHGKDSCFSDKGIIAKSLRTKNIMRAKGWGYSGIAGLAGTALWYSMTKKTRNVNFMTSLQPITALGLISAGCLGVGISYLTQDYAWKNPFGKSAEPAVE